MLDGALTADLDLAHVAVRVASAADAGAVGYAGQSWLRTARRLAPWRWMAQADYWRDHRACVFSALQSPRCTLLVATLSDDPDLFLGVLLCEPSANVLHWVQVKAPFRGVDVLVDGKPTSVCQALLSAAEARGLDTSCVVYTTAPDGKLGYEVRDSRGEPTGEHKPGEGLFGLWQSLGWVYNPYPLTAHQRRASE